MVSELNASGGGLEPEVGAFARHVDSDQNIEIARMQEPEEGDAGLAAARRAGPSPAVRERAERLSYAGGSSCALLRRLTHSAASGSGPASLTVRMATLLRTSVTPGSSRSVSSSNCS